MVEVSRSGMRLSSETDRIMAWWEAANYLTVAQIYLQDNPLLSEPLRPEHIKPRLLGHWGTSPGLNLVYAHLNALIRRTGQEVLFIAGPGHGGPAIVANVYLEGTYSEVYPRISRDEEGLRRLVRQFSTPGGIPSHVGVPTPGSIHEGGELGYSLVHAFGAAFDNPDLLVACVIGDGEAETGPLEASWKGTRFLNPGRDGAVLPILHLNEHKISGPTVLGRATEDEITDLLRAHSYEPFFVEGHEVEAVHVHLHQVLDAGPRAHSGDPARRSKRRFAAAGEVAGDRAAHAEGVDRAARSRRPPDRRHVPRSPGAAGLGARGPCAPGAARGLDARLPPGEALRRRRAAGPRVAERDPAGSEADGCALACQRRLAQPPAGDPRPRTLSSRGRATGHRRVARPPGRSGS